MSCIKNPASCRQKLAIPALFSYYNSVERPDGRAAAASKGPHTVRRGSDMNRILNRLGHVLAGISLKRKILYIVLFSIILVSCAGISGLQLATSAYNRLLQDTLARNLSYSATTVSFYLANIETMSGLMQPPDIGARRGRRAGAAILARGDGRVEKARKNG